MHFLEASGHNRNKLFLITNVHLVQALNFRQIILQFLHSPSSYMELCQTSQVVSVLLQQISADIGNPFINTLNLFSLQRAFKQGSCHLPKLYCLEWITMSHRNVSKSQHAFSSAAMDIHLGLESLVDSDLLFSFKRMHKKYSCPVRHPIQTTPAAGITKPLQKIEMCKDNITHCRYFNIAQSV
ncbi:hypothetical protein B0H13DRAFT_1903383 [Mycena leptocephala]|nr:hypothetical protein B0H13DRAFT_1903383 [Mycena leptocephala]